MPIFTSWLDSERLRGINGRHYPAVLDAMQTFSRDRQADTPDQVWFMEHSPVFTQGQAGKPEHLLQSPESAGEQHQTLNGIPLVHTDRGGQVTYHGPGQLMIYPLLDLRRHGLHVRSLVSLLESSVVNTLLDYQIDAEARRNAPGVYVKADGAKIASIGLRITRGVCYHGLALNVAMDLAPFKFINPCGYAGLSMAQISDYLGDSAQLPAGRVEALQSVATCWRHHFTELLARHTAQPLPPHID